jgi:multisubunit Na+/H+ antiporter MnhG subunit
MRAVVAAGFVWAGALLAVLCALAALISRQDVFLRLHLVSPVSALAVPLVALGLAVDADGGFQIAEMGVVAVLSAVSGPALVSATGRLAAQRAGLVPPVSPE